MGIGIHGVAVMGAVFQPIWFSLLDQNIDAKAWRATS